MLSENARYAMWLANALGIPSKTVPALLEKFGTVKAVYEASREEIFSSPFLSKSEKASLSEKSMEAIRRDIEYCEAQSVGVLCYEDAAYPASLRSIDAPPLVLYYRGKLPDFNVLPMFAIVGTRTMSRSGAEATCEIAFDLGKMGAVTVSGMALGIDGVAAAATLESGGITVAVLGSGIDYIYPPEHRLLYAEIVRKGGLVITEYPPYERPLGFHFPVRNRIISGLSEAVIVIEGSLKSGALITAEEAKRQGKRVFALPGNIKDKGSEGPLLLLKNGASPITCSDDIYDAYKEKYLPYLNGFHLTDGRKTELSLLTAKYGIYARNPGASYRPTDEEEEYLSLSSLAQGAVSAVKRAVRTVEEGALSKRRGKGVASTAPSASSSEDARAPSFWNEMSETEQKIYLAIGEEGNLPDDIRVENLSTAELISALINMEICGYVFASSGGIYKRNR